MERGLTSPLSTEAGFDCNKRLYNDATTMLAEALDGHMRTPFEYCLKDGDLIADDGSSLTEIFDGSLAEAHELVAREPNLAFEPRRRQHERDELDEMLAMARGEAPNTMVVVSDFPPELMDASGTVGGYNPERKQTMLRVLLWRENRLKMYSQSLDGSDRQALEAIYAQFGLRPQPGELLGQRIHIDLNQEKQERLIDELTAAYDASLQEQYEGMWYAGRLQTPEEQRSGINTYDFVLAQHDLVHHVMDCHRTGILDKDEVYNVIALLEERLKEYKTQDIASGVTLPQTYASPFSNLREELERAGREAMAEGKVFGACGLTIERHAELSASEQLAQAGYGDQTAESYRFDKKMHCVVCQSEPKKDEPKKWCGPCGICRSCDAQLKKSGKG